MSSEADAADLPPTLAFPAFRSPEWIKSDFEKIKAPPEILDGVDLSPQYMTNTPNLNLYQDKVRHVRQQIRNALFRQALFRIQNVEVTYLDECKDLRVIKNIVENKRFSLSGKITDWQHPKDVDFLRDELWTVDRCGQSADYSVRYYKEGSDGFSTIVLPQGLRDRWRWIKFHYISGE
mmetsp:Transcript_33641/g.78631  ORF Transcript_33641/g.78631 Transcript_33641/m.78631 type:complete len:178 (-) Transcript_33641:13-546(-)